MLQVGFGLTPFRSGLITFASAVGALFMKTLARADHALASAPSDGRCDDRAVFGGLRPFRADAAPVILVLLISAAPALAAVHRHQRNQLRR